ncbi:hypothetical protein EDF56_10429 [Novosphingobium sp. PhB165]|uniref:hypothetical protein n=1 Tax=Novosphingobium sp. PhB165 TaxID=2485105 RepID=UPI00104EFA2F|nr:hypothetical protein [Novosphingobium sp. PhB165]TCM18499.1 hypothetical protein EDF56_10429 [Novosphingobium sp. PhB165]
MDTLRGEFTTRDGPDSGYDSDDSIGGHETRSSFAMGDERRMQVRAYNFWASLLGDRQFPDIADLRPDEHPDFGPHGVLLDFSGGIDDPRIAWLGAALAEECGAQGEIGSLGQVPSRSLLSRITDHYMQILANEAPIGFEAEFVNLRGATVLYRGILLPFARDPSRIEWIYGVINWKEIADQASTDALMRQVDDMLVARSPLPRDPLPLGGWADGPAEIAGAGGALPDVAFGEGEVFGGSRDGEFVLDDTFMLGEPGMLDESGELDILELTADMELADWLASARELAQAAVGAEDRSRQALYAAIGRAYDFVLAASDAPDELAELLEDAGLKVQDRAPLVPLMKLVFGADYDKTRLTEFAGVIAHAQRLGLGRGDLTPFLAAQPGGIKAVVRDERRLRREESDRAAQGETRHDRMVRGLRALSPKALSEVGKDSEFTILVARRDERGEVVLLGEVSDDDTLLDRAARRLLE